MEDPKKDNQLASSEEWRKLGYQLRQIQGEPSRQIEIQISRKISVPSNRTVQNTGQQIRKTPIELFRKNPDRNQVAPLERY